MNPSRKKVVGSVAHLATSWHKVLQIFHPLAYLLPANLKETELVRFNLLTLNVLVSLWYFKDQSHVTLYRFIEGQTHYGMPYNELNLAINECTKEVALHSSLNTTSEHSAPQVDRDY